MLIPGQPVRCSLYGLGQVVEGGDPPIVHFLDGFERLASPESIQAVSRERFEAEIANRAQIEAYLHMRVYGGMPLGDRGRVFVRDDGGFWMPATMATESESEERPVRFVRAVEVVTQRQNDVHSAPQAS